MKAGKLPGAAELRRRAEQHLRGIARPPRVQPETQRLLHELQVHQIELELQNEELRASRALVEAGLARYTDLYDFSPVGYFTLERDGTILQTNLTGARLLGIERTRLTGRRFGAFVAAADLAGLDAFLQQVFTAQPHPACELHLNGEGRPPLIVQIEATLGADGQACHAVVTDITARAQAEARLQLAASVFTHAREGIIITSAAGTILEVNAAFTRITGYRRDEALGRDPRMLDSGVQGPEFYAAMAMALARDGQWSGEIWNRRKSGEVYVESTTISAVRDADGRTRNYVTLFTDITAMKAHQQQLEHIAHYDALTNLPNRVLLADRLQQAMLQCERHERALAVAYLDLDGFKVVNDRHGHNTGDELLIALAHRMKTALREGDTLARIGSDEFVAVLVDLEEVQDCVPVLVRLLQAAAAPATVGDALLHVSASIGVTLYPQDAANADQLMRHADQAMYQAKQAGKNRYHLFDVVQDVALQSRHESLEHIRRALAQREFVLYYQPKINMRTGVVIGAEALIRWQHPERGLLLPTAFLPIIEDHPISVELGEWVLAAVLAQMSAWHAAGQGIPVSVNIGAHQLQQDEFVPQLTALLLAHPDVQHRFLELEVLETSALEDMAHVSEVMHACHALGVRFALDDFGTGYSSLTYLKRLPAERLKIDQSFVLGMIDDADDRAIVEGVIGLVRAFHREVIAEGVETAAHGELLLALGCDLAQGNGIARPMPAADLPAWVASWHRAWPERRCTAH
ncbi:EAL domain-containing protein [Thauera aromatica]|uniref:putative bifunctional diguanylate cyclase/phosphodiesterase n=1 Tax=Thauera aromatica TaxID=59405 RepID=UPI001FFD241E|nr:EAL domain-containing protein [Thauera aromatica]MCK2089174.1 EAL domain-containing protein [Thauera aromatica]